MNRKFNIIKIIVLLFCAFQVNAQNTLNNLGLTNTTLSSAAYSFRLLSSGYSGPLARITIGTNYYDVYPDTSNNKNFSLNSPISAAYTTYNAAPTGVTSNLLSSIVNSSVSATIAIWYDQSGNAKDAFQATTNSQPRIINTGVVDSNNGLPAMTFQNASQVLEYSGSITVQTINTVRSAPNANWQTLLAIPANSDFSVRGANGSLYNISPNSNDWTYGTSPNQTWVNQNQTIIYTNTTVHTAFIVSLDPKIGTMSINSTFYGRGMYGGAAVNEIVLFPNTINTIGRTTIETNQIEKYLVGFITTQPNSSNQSVALGGIPMDLSVSSGVSGVTFQWYSNTTNSNSGGILLPGQTNSTYTPETSAEGTKYYYVIVSSSTLSVTSTISGSVRVGIEITSQPTSNNQTVIQGSAVNPINIEVTGSNLTYQWYKNTTNNNSTGTIIPGANFASFYPSSASLGTLYYYVKITVGNTTIVSNASGFVRIITPPIIWNGPLITFHKSDNANYTSSLNQDYITNNVKITRASSQGLFNFATEGNYSYNSPYNTEWAEGTLLDFSNLNFSNWYSAFNGYPPSKINHTFVVHLINENIYFQLTLLSWTSGGSGGGFSYSRTTPNPCITSNLNSFNSVIKTNFDGSYTITPPTTNSSGAITYASSNTNVATISGTTVTIVGIGTSIITATQAADATYYSSSITATLTVNSVSVLTKNGEVSTTSLSYVNKNGALGSSTSLSINGEVISTKSNNGLTAANAGSSAYQIKTDFPNSVDGMYWIKNPNINGGTPFQIYADMTTNGGGWTLILSNNSSTGWNGTNAILRNENSPTIDGQYSIIAYADYIKKGASGFQYMIDATTRRSWGGIWTANEAYSFVHTSNDQTNVTINTKFNSWDYNDQGVEQIMPWYTPGFLGAITTSTLPSDNSWGTLVSSGAFSPVPWMNCCNQNPGIIWYWVR